MAAVSGGGNKWLSAQGGEIVLAHKPLNPLGIHDGALPSEFSCDAVEP